jgi:hypothetical protein
MWFQRLSIDLHQFFISKVPVVIGNQTGAVNLIIIRGECRVNGGDSYLICYFSLKLRPCASSVMGSGNGKEDLDIFKGRLGRRRRKSLNQKQNWSSKDSDRGWTVNLKSQGFAHHLKMIWHAVGLFGYLYLVDLAILTTAGGLFHGDAFTCMLK